MNTMEKIARALCVASGGDPDGTDGMATFVYSEVRPNGLMVCGRYHEGWDWKDSAKRPRSNPQHANWEWFLGDAQAALEALKHPDEGTVEAMVHAMFGDLELWPETLKNAAKASFTAGISHIQKGEG